MLINADLINTDLINADQYRSDQYRFDQCWSMMINPDPINTDSINADQWWSIQIRSMLINPDPINTDTINTALINADQSRSDQCRSIWTYCSQWKNIPPHIQVQAQPWRALMFSCKRTPLRYILCIVKWKTWPSIFLVSLFLCYVVQQLG